jgi:hypothetical protein
MELTLRFIGIILMFQLETANKQTYEVYLPDGRSEPVACAEFIPEHFAFIRVMTPIDEDKINWPWVPCADGGGDCKLFPLDNEEIRISDITGGDDVDVIDTAKMMPLYKDYTDKQDSLLDTAAKRQAASVAFLTFNKGKLTGHAFSNGMKYSKLEIKTIQGTEIKVEGNSRSFVAPKGSVIDIINLPFEIAAGTPGTHTGNDRTHYFLYHKLMDPTKQPTMPCVSPADKMTAVPGHGGSTAAGVALSVACSNTNYP